MSNRRDPAWRDRAAAELVIKALPGLGLPGPALVMGDPLPDLAGFLAAAGTPVSSWNRRAYGATAVAPWPPPGPFRTAFLRLPPGKGEFAMNLHAAASVLTPGGVVLVYGARDEGIQAASGPVKRLFTDVETVAVGGRCRLLRGTLGPDLSGLKGTLREWRIVWDPGYPDLPEAWVSYPGVFSHGRLDEGTRILLEALPPLPPGARILDYGCGSGIVGHVALGRGEGVEMHLSDVDTLALEAARENVPGARIHLLDGLPEEMEGPFDAILSNPPFHRGKGEDPALVVSLIEGAPLLLKPRGWLVFVTQRRLSVERVVARRFQETRVLSETSTFRVWRGLGPRKEKEGK